MSNKQLRTLALTLATACLTHSTPETCVANLISNGGFEVPLFDPGDFQTIAPGNEPPGFAWTVASGNVDAANLPNFFVDFESPERENALDLNGTRRGSLFQDFPTSPGQLYELRFLYTDNSQEGGISTADIDVTDVGSSNPLLSDSISHFTADNGTGAPGDGDPDTDAYFNTFTATGTLTRLQFTSTSASNSASGGIILDAVSVGVPLPGDFDHDCDVDVADLLVWQRGFGNPYDADDLADWRQHFGTTHTLTAEATSVPEPASIVFLITTALVGLRTTRSITTV